MSEVCFVECVRALPRADVYSSSVFVPMSCALFLLFGRGVETCVSCMAAHPPLRPSYDVLETILCAVGAPYASAIAPAKSCPDCGRRPSACTSTQRSHEPAHRTKRPPAARSQHSAPVCARARHKGRSAQPRARARTGGGGGAESVQARDRGRCRHSHALQGHAHALRGRRSLRAPRRGHLGRVERAVEPVCVDRCAPVVERRLRAARRRIERPELRGHVVRARAAQKTPPLLLLLPRARMRRRAHISTQLRRQYDLAGLRRRRAGVAKREHLHHRGRARRGKPRSEPAPPRFRVGARAHGGARPHAHVEYVSSPVMLTVLRATTAPASNSRDCAPMRTTLTPVDSSPCSRAW